MKRAALMICALVLAGCLAGLAVAQHSYGPSVYYDQLSAGTWTNVAGLSSNALYSSGGTYTNGVYTNHYRVSYTNIRGRGPGASWKIVFTGNTNGNSAHGTNAVNISWAAKGGAASYIVEKSHDAGATWTNWVSVGASSTNWIDRGTNSWTNSIFTNAYSLIPSPPTVFTSGTPFQATTSTGQVQITNGTIYIGFPPGTTNASGINADITPTNLPGSGTSQRDFNVRVDVKAGVLDTNIAARLMITNYNWLTNVIGLSNQHFTAVFTGLQTSNGTFYISITNLQAYTNNDTNVAVAVGALYLTKGTQLLYTADATNFFTSKTGTNYANSDSNLVAHFDGLDKFAGGVNLTNGMLAAGSNAWNVAASNATVLTSRVYVTSYGTGIGGPAATNLDIYQVGGNPAIRLTDPRDSGSWTPGTAIGTLEYLGSDLSGPGLGIRAYVKAIVDNAAGTSYSLDFGVSSNAAVASAMRIYGDKRVETLGPTLRTAFLIQTNASWDDLNYPAIESARVGTDDISVDTSDMTLSFATTASTNVGDDHVMVSGEMPHSWKTNTDVRPHVHFYQTNADQTNMWFGRWRWMNSGAVATNDFIDLGYATNVYGYSAPTTFQYAAFASLPGAGRALGSVVQVRLYRDGNFGTGNAKLVQFGIHYQVDGLGSDSETSKGF